MSRLTRVIARYVGKITQSSVAREHWPRARARFKSEIAKIPLRANLGNVKVPGGTTPQAFLVQSLSRGQRTSCQIMMDLADFVLDNKSRAIDRTELGALDRLQLYRLYKNLKCKGEMKAALNDQIQEMSRRPLDDKALDLLIDLKSMRNALVDIESVVEDLLKQNDIEVSLDDAAMDESVRDRILDALEGAWDSVKQKTDLPALELVKIELAKPPVETPFDCGFNLAHLTKMLADDGHIKPALLRRTLVPALRQAGEAHPEATAREAAAILSRKHERIHLHGLFYGFRNAMYQQFEGKEGAGADLLRTVAAIKVSNGHWEELRVPKLAEAVESGGLGVWAAVHDLASYAHASKDLDAAVREVIESQMTTFHGKTASAFLKIAGDYFFQNEAGRVRHIIRDVHEAKH